MRFRTVFLAIFVLTLVMAIIPAMLYAQTNGGSFDWSSLGVDVVVVGVIISVVQMIKNVLPKKVLPWAPLILAMLFSAVYGAATNAGSIESILKFAFTYATAAAWLYEAAKSVGVKSLKGKRELGGG